MKNQIKSSSGIPKTANPRRVYKRPALQCFGPVIELTNSAVGSCMSDGFSSCNPASGMSRMS